MTVKAETPKSDFSALLADIASQSTETETLAKAIGEGTGEDDAKIEAAAAEGAEGEGKDKDKDCDDEGKPMAKALKIVDPETGEESEGMDAGPLLKSLMDRVEAGETNTTEALGAVVGLVKQQGALLKSLADKIEAQGNLGRGRKAVVSIADPPAAAALAKSLGADEGDEGDKPAGLNGREFLAKALDAAKAGRISYSDASYCETVINRGLQPPVDLVRAVLEPAAAA